ncbi:MAG: nitroreductase family protein [Chloroflexota bacterium]
MDLLTAIHQRVSVRSYTDRSVDPALLERLLDFAPGAPHLTPAPPRVALITGVEEVERVLTFMIGSYGLVQNTPHLLVGILPQEGEQARVDLGFVLEQVVLEATRLGLGTCWITGSYDADRAGDAAELRRGEVAGAVCALGHPTEEGYGRLHNRIIRRLAGGHRRKPLIDIVFSDRWGEQWSPEDADPALLTVLKHARLAPSAHNAQPWRFIIGADHALTLALIKPRFIDAGIVMSHVTLSSRAAGRPGRWALRIGDESLAHELRLPDSVTPVAVFDLSGP